jgi:hypothetical protein
MSFFYNVCLKATSIRNPNYYIDCCASTSITLRSYILRMCRIPNSAHASLTQNGSTNNIEQSSNSAPLVLCHLSVLQIRSHTSSTLAVCSFVALMLNPYLLVRLAIRDLNSQFFLYPMALNIITLYLVVLGTNSLPTLT